MLRTAHNSGRMMVVVAALLVSPLVLTGCDDLVAQATTGLIDSVTQGFDASMLGSCGGYTCDTYAYDAGPSTYETYQPSQPSDPDDLFDSSWDSWRDARLPYCDEPIWFE